VYINDLPGNSLNGGVIIVAEKGLERKDLEELFAAFENRQDEKAKAREQRQDEKSIAFEKRQDEKFIAFEKRQDENFKAFEERQDKKFEAFQEGQDHKFIAFEKRQDEKSRSLEERVVHQFHIISEGLIDQIKLLAEGHSGVVDRLDRMEKRFDQLEKENERQHLETRALVKLSFSELDRRLSTLESQVRDLLDWRKRIESRLQL
jgi:hypothetical protein